MGNYENMRAVLKNVFRYNSTKMCIVINSKQFT